MRNFFSRNRASAPERARGFTLIEASVVIFVFAMITYGVAAMVSAIVVNTNKQEGMLYDSSQARRISFQIMQELRAAQASNSGAYGLNSAGNQELIFFSNIDGGTDIERVRYFIQSGLLRKGIIKPTGSPLTYSTGNEAVTTVQNYVANAAVPLFYYYDGTYTGVTDNYLTQPVSVIDVKYIRMNLRIRQRGGVTNAGYYTVTAGAAIRNLKTNLAD